MAGEDRSHARLLALRALLETHPERLGFHQILRRIEHANSDRPRLGESTHPADDAVRLSQEPTLAFTPTPITGVEWTKTGVPRLITVFLGLFGPNAPMPTHITEYARDRMRNASDPTFAHFVDLFHHRMLSLYYRAQANTEPAFGEDRPATNRWNKYLGSLVGMGTPATRQRDALPDKTKLYYAGRLAPQVRTAEGLRAMIAEYFGVKAEIEELVGEWIDLPPEACWSLSKGQKAELGRGTTVGKRAWSCQSKFRVVIGPVAHERVPAFLPGGDSYARLSAMVRGYVGDQLAWDLRLVLPEKGRPAWRLGGPSRLGWDSWLGGKRTTPPSVVVKG